MKTFIADLQINSPVDIFLMVAEKRLVPFRDPAKGRYLALVLVDRTGQIEGRAWERADELAEGCGPGDVVRITGVVEEYKETRQLRLTSLQRLAESAFDLADYLAVTPKDRKLMADRLDELVASVREPHLARLLALFFGDPEFRRGYLEAPAAKRVHHNYLGGLLEHSLEVAELVETVASFAPQLNRDLALAGALLHDIGKLREYQVRPLIDLTDEGKLFGHTVMGCELLRERLARVEELPRDLAVGLEHILLTHHGELEWGAPVLPQTLEAAAVHYADLLSSRVKQYQQVAMPGGQGGPDNAGRAAWSAYDSLLGRSLYLGGK